VGANGGSGVVEGKVGVNSVRKWCWDVLVDAGCNDVLVFSVLKGKSGINERIGS
jgi:hypothetical protein